MTFRAKLNYQKTSFKLNFSGKTISDLYQLIGKCLKLKDDFYRVGRALKPSAIIDLEKIALQCGT